MKESTYTVLGVIGSLMALASVMTFGATAIIGFGIGIFLMTKRNESSKAKMHAWTNLLLNGFVLLVAGGMILLTSM